MLVNVLVGHQLAVPEMSSRLPIESPQDAGFNQGKYDLALNSANIHVGQDGVILMVHVEIVTGLHLEEPLDGPGLGIKGQQ